MLAAVEFQCASRRLFSKMKLFALLAIVAICSANIAVPSMTAFKDGKRYIYNYVTLMEVPNPLKINLTTTLRVNSTVDLWFRMDSEKKMFEVLMNMRAPEFKVLKIDPLAPEMPLETIMELKHAARQQLLQPVVFFYDNGIIRVIKHAANEELWSLNLKKGFLNLFHLDIVATHTKGNVFENIELSIHGKCVSAYSVDIPAAPLTGISKMMSLRKTIDLATCNQTGTQTFSNVLLEKLKLKGERPENPLKSLTSITYEIVKTSAGFKIIKVLAEGHVMFDPMDKSRVAFKAVTYQTLLFIEEEPFKVLPPLPSNLKTDTLIMMPEVVVNKLQQELGELEKVLKELIVDLKTDIKDVSKPLPERLLVRCIQMVKMLREIPIENVQTLWKKFVEEGQDQEIKDWFVHVLTMVGTENSMKVVLNELISKPKIVSTELITEFMAAMSLTPFVTKELIKRIEQYCQLPIIANDKTLKKTCVLAVVNAMRSYCEMVPYCEVKTPKALMDVLKKIESATDFPLADLTEQDILEYLTIAETVESPEIVTPLLKTMRKNMLPIHIRVQSVLTFVKLAPKLQRQVTVPMLKVYRDMNLPEEIRLAALKVILEYPEPSILLACVHYMKVEPSLNIRSHLWDFLSTEHTDLPVQIIESIKLAKEVLQRQRIFPVQNRIIREYIKTNFFMSKGSDFLVKRSMYYTNQSVIPRSFMGEMALRIMGRRVNLVGIEWRAEGLQELLLRITNMVAGKEKQLPEKMKRFFKQISNRSSVIPEEGLNMLFKLNILGRPYLTTFMAVNKTEDLIKELLFGDSLNLVEIASKLRRGYEKKINKIMMPAQMIMRLSTCGGVTLIHDLSTVLITKAKATLKTTTTPDMFSLKNILLGKTPEEVELSLNLKLSSSMLMQGSAFFNLPFVKFGAVFTQTYSLNNKNRYSVNLNFKTMEHKTVITAPKIEDIMGLRSDSGNFLWMEENAKVAEPKLYRLKPEYMREKLSVISSVLKPDVRLEDTVLLKVNSKYVTVQNGQFLLKTAPVEWRLVHHGRTGRVVSLFMPTVGYLAIKPNTKDLMISKTPFYWIPKIPAEKEIILQALVPATLPTPLRRGMLYRLFEFSQIYQQEEIDVKEIEKVHRMFNEDLFAYKVQIGTLGVDGNRLIVGEEDTAIKASVLRSSLENLKRFGENHAFCLGEKNQFSLCFYGIHTALPIFEKSLFESLFTPTFLKVTYPPNQPLTAIKIQNAQSELEKNKVVYKLKMIMKGTSPEYVLVLRSLRQTDDGKMSIVLRQLRNGKEISKLMCLNMDMFKDSLSLRMSLEPQCQKNHFMVKTIGSPVFPRHFLRFDWFFTSHGIPDTWFTNGFVRPLLKQLDALSGKLLPIIFGEYVDSREFYPVQRLPLVDSGIYNGSIEVRLTSSKDAKISILKPSKTIIHRLILPFEIYSLPVGSVNYPIISGILNTAPNCFHGRDFFNTFDGVPFIYRLPKCEHVLVQNTDPRAPRLLIAVRQTKLQMKIFRVVLGSTEILVEPVEYNQVPIVKIDEKKTPLKDNKLEIVLHKKYHVLFTYDPYLHTLVVLNKELGMELHITGGRTISVRVSRLLAGRINGLCGNYDGETMTEFTTPERVKVEDKNVFGCRGLSQPQNAQNAR